MKWHPAGMMIWTWIVIVAIFMILPLHVVNRDISFYGFAILTIFILTFAIGAWLRTPPLLQRHAPQIDMPRFERMDLIIAVTATIAIVALLLDLRNGTGGDLSASWQVRDDRAGAILSGTESGSSLFFQIGFLTSPIAFTAIAREVIYQDRIRLPRLLAFGFGPLVAASLALGGRGPLLFALVMFALSWNVRSFIRRDSRRKQRKPLKPQQIVIAIVMTIIGLGALNYFVQVFNARAASAGGGEAIFDLTSDNWGVTFDGPAADWMIAILGAGNTYLIFVFSWYLTQGLIISNVLFTSYAGPPMYGLYGIELLIALMRRINGDFVAQQFAALNDLNVFGFVSSAFGTFYVDYWFFGFVIVFGWGYVAALVYEKARTSTDGRWLLAVPFVAQGIFFSVINTPIGLTNGLVTHFWMIVAILLSRPRKAVLAPIDLPAE